jgi:hypothetical protein
MAATWDDVSAIAQELPAAEEGIRFGDPTWKVGKNVFGWVRPLRTRDREELGAAAPTHHRALRRLPREVVTDAWLARAPKRLVTEFLTSGRT